MIEPSAVDAASKRLALALDALAAAVERRHEADRGEQTLDDQLHALGTDRARLAAELDAAAWERVSSLPTPRNYARSVVYRGRIYVVGGGKTFGASHTAAGSRVVETFVPG